MMRKTKIRFWTILLIVTLAGVTPCGGAEDEAEEASADYVYDSHDKRDPFWPLVNSKGMIVNLEKDLLATDLVLEGIYVGDGGKSVAIINGKILQKDESIGVFTVKDIKENRVTLQKGQERVILKLKKED